MNHLLALHALRELATNERVRRQIDRLGLMYVGAMIVVVLSFPLFPHLT